MILPTREPRDQHAAAREEEEEEERGSSVALEHTALGLYQRDQTLTSAALPV